MGPGPMDPMGPMLLDNFQQIDQTLGAAAPEEMQQQYHGYQIGEQAHFDQYNVGAPAPNAEKEKEQQYQEYQVGAAQDAQNQIVGAPLDDLLHVNNI